MNDLRSIWMAALAGVAAFVAAFVFVLLQGPSQRPAPAGHQAGMDKDKSPAAPKSSARVSEPTTLHYYRVRVALDGTLQAGKRTFHLYGAEIPGREYTCTYRNGQRWACGLRSYVALLNVIGTDPIECGPRNALKPDVVICHRDNIDLSEWMLKNGWARLANGVADERYVKAAKAASDAKIGMWTE